MSDTIQIRAGNKKGMPTLADREPAYVRDENAFYIGTDSGNKKIGAELEEFVGSLGRSLAAEGERVTNLSLAVESVRSDLNSQGKVVAEQGAALTEHGNTLSQHGETILQQGATIAEHTAAIAEQKAGLAGKLSASPVAAQEGVAADADLATAVAALNALISAMKSSGVMNA